jgi:hypothetical protein
MSYLQHDTSSFIFTPPPKKHRTRPSTGPVDAQNDGPRVSVSKRWKNVAEIALRSNDGTGLLGAAGRNMCSNAVRCGLTLSLLETGPWFRFEDFALRTYIWIFFSPLF